MYIHIWYMCIYIYIYVYIYIYTHISIYTYNIKTCRGIESLSCSVSTTVDVYARESQVFIIWNSRLWVMYMYTNTYVLLIIIMIRLLLLWRIYTLVDSAVAVLAYACSNICSEQAAIAVASDTSGNTIVIESWLWLRSLIDRCL